MPQTKSIITLLSSLALLSSCSWFMKDEFLLPGERADVFRTTTQNETAMNPTASLPFADGKTFGGGVKLAWSAAVGTTGNRYQTHAASPSFAGSTIYTIDNRSKVTALNTGGKTAWTSDVRREGENPAVIGGGTLRAGDALYVGTGSSQIVKLAASNGKKIWAKSVDAPLRSAPLVSGDTMFAQSFGNIVYALKTQDASEVWRYDGAGLDKNGAQTSTQPILVDGTLIAYFNTGDIVALDAKTGELKWRESVFSNRANFAGGSTTAPQSQLLYTGGLVIAGSVGSETAAIDPKTGAKRWSRNFGVASNISAGDTNLYLIDENQNVRAINKSTGQDVWSQALPAYENFEKKRGKYHWFGPAVKGGELFVVSNKGHVVVLSSSGKLARGEQMRAKFSSSPVTYQAVVYAIDDSGKLLALR